MKTQSILLIGLVLLALSIGVFYACEIGAKDDKPNSINRLFKSNQQAIEDCLTIQVMDRTYQIDGKVEVTYTNICPNYAFRLTKTGMKYEAGSKTKYLTRKTPLFIGAASTETLELSIPFAIKPRVAYALADDAKAIAIK